MLCAYVARASDRLTPVSWPSTHLNTSRALAETMEIQPSCYADYRKPLNIIADGLCAYLDDLAPFVCAARGLVTDAGWQAHCDSCWPEWSGFLPGCPMRRVRALRAFPSEVDQPLMWLDPTIVSPKPSDNIVLLELKRAGAVLWRSTSQILVYQPTYNYHGHEHVEAASFDMPANIVAAIDAEMVQWWQRTGGTWPPPDYEATGRGSYQGQDKEGFDIECWLQAWVQGKGVGPHVFHPCMSLFSVAWELAFPAREAFTTILYTRDFVVGDDLYGSIDFEICLYRKDYSTRGMNAPIEATAMLTGRVAEHDSFLTSGYLSKLTNIYIQA